MFISDYTKNLRKWREEELLKYLKDEGHSVKKILHEATILHNGWESDNYGWIVELENNRIVKITTSHGGHCVWSEEELIDSIKETQESLNSLLKAFEYKMK